MKILKKIWSDPVWSKVIATAILACFGYFALRLAGWEAVLWDAARTAWAYSTADIGIPRWVAVIVGGWALLTLGIVIAERFRPAKIASWLSYTEDKFYGLVWRWRLSERGRVDRLSVFCPVCDFQLVPSYDDYAFEKETRFNCKCGQAGPWRFAQSWDALEDDIERTVQQKLRNETWKHAVKR